MADRQDISHQILSPNKGWIRLWRQLQEHWLWLEKRRFSRAEAWIDLLLSASYKEHEVLKGNRVITVKRGQVLTSQVNLAVKWRWARKSVYSFLKLLKRDFMLHIETVKGIDKGFTLLTIGNYPKYQGSDEQPKQSEKKEGLPIEGYIGGTSEGHRRGNINKGKERKRIKKPPFSENDFWGRFTSQDQDIIRQTIEAIRSTRETEKVANSVIQREMVWWSKQESTKVISGMRIYLDKGYAAQGKDEKYLRGIIRRQLNSVRVQDGQSDIARRIERLKKLEEGVYIPGGKDGS